MQKLKLKGTLLACSLALSGATFAAPSGAMLGNTCAGCHGTNGNSVGPASPTIAGMDTEVFIDAMTTYKDDSRPSTIMGRLAKGYSEDEIAAMAEYFAGQKFQPADQPFDPALADKGGKVHERYCEKCHEDGGRSAEDGGILAGQWTPYMVYAMEDFMSGAREMPKKMKRQVEKMQKRAGKGAAEQLLHFYASQK
ncbi:MAG: c-type cytochrome [Gammaproteobacteria bacterium SHHR-1]|uniref:c-type cytochrome n=1 Tax=Magnetovirga frankeli TaxID=947516 RepID=UPI0012930D26|nr:c-type cytochrome [gamma proteobacterium SS-5]